MARCLTELGGIDPVLASWFRRGASRAAAKTPVSLSPTNLGALFERGRNRRDFGGEAIEELGFRVGMWNRARPAVGLSVHAGSFSTHPGILNSFVLNVPGPDDGAGALYQPAEAAAIFEAVVQAWEPEWATWTTHEWREAQSPAPRQPVIGWFTYLAAPVSVALPGTVSRPVPGGTIITIGQDMSHVAEAVVLDARARLSQVGALHRSP